MSSIESHNLKKKRGLDPHLEDSCTITVVSHCPSEIDVNKCTGKFEMNNESPRIVSDYVCGTNVSMVALTLQGARVSPKRALRFILVGVKDAASDGSVWKSYGNAYNPHGVVRLQIRKRSRQRVNVSLCIRRTDDT